MKAPAASRAENVTDWVVPGTSANGDAGEALIPFGNPLTVTVTEFANPFCGVRDTMIGALVEPTCVETETAEMEILKSGVGGGETEDEPPPHAVSMLTQQVEIRKDNAVFMRHPFVR